MWRTIYDCSEKENLEDAKKAIKQNIQDEKSSIFQFSKLMDERLNELLELPVPKDWDGVYTAQTK